MWRPKNLQKHRLKFIILGFVVLALWILGPSAKWLWPGNWWGTTLVVMMNENEARPCGGFATAYAEINLPFGGAKLQNSFGLPPHNLGQNSAPLSQVSTTRQWWDLGDTTDLSTCAAQFASGYAQVEAVAPDRVILVQSGVIEDWLKAIGGVNLQDQIINETNFFAITSRAVADVDRHDEKALAERKGALGLIGKKLILKTIFTPWNWYKVTRSVGVSEQNYQLYHHKVEDPKIEPWVLNKDRTILISEWNLGGGKSSRYLDKNWSINLKQNTADTWDVLITLKVDHLGGQDEPLSQLWRGGFELQMFDENKIFIPAEIQPGESFSSTHTFSITTSQLMVPRKSLGQSLGLLALYAPIYQNWHTQLQVQALGQQTLNPYYENLNAKENAATWKGAMPVKGKSFGFTLQPDRLSPFLTWHKPLDATKLAPEIRSVLAYQSQDTMVELHFNEPVNLVNRSGQLTEVGTVFTNQELDMRLIDRDFTVKNKTENPVVKGALLFEDKQTLLLNVSQSEYQKDERFYIEIDNVSDLWGNISNINKRTVITR